MLNIVEWRKCLKSNNVPRTWGYVSQPPQHRQSRSTMKHKNHKKDELTQKYNALNALEPYWQKSTATIRDSLTEFEKRYPKIKSYETTISDDALAYKLLKAGNLQTRNEKLVKAMITELQYDAVKTK